MVDEADDSPSAGANHSPVSANRHAVGVCLIIAALRRRFRASPGTRWRRIVPGVALWHPDRADLVRKMNQFAKKPFRRDAAFLFSH
jgi:hypothetical protein